MWINCNPNPKRKHVPDCVIRALVIALDKSWYDVTGRMQSEIDSLRNDIRELKDAVMQMKTPANPQRNQNNQRGGNQNA